MPRSRFAVLAVLSLIVLGCQNTRVNVQREKETLLATDREWAGVASAGKGVDSIVAYWTDDAYVITPNQPTLQGRPAIRNMVERSLGMPGFHITWEPENAAVAHAGDLGYTVGKNQVTMPDSTGRPVTVEGRYLSVWRKEPDGKWRCVAECSTPNPPETRIANPAGAADTAGMGTTP